MPEGDLPGTTDEGGAGTPGASPAPPAASVGTGEDYEARFKGLQGTHQSVVEENRRLKAQLAAQPAAAPATPATPGIAPELEQMLAQQRETMRMLLEGQRRTIAESLVKEFPYATADDIVGDDPDQWRASAEAAHKRIEAQVAKATEAEKERIRKQVADEFGVPLGGEAPAAGSDLSDALKEAKERHDPLLAARILVTGGAK